MQYNRRSLDCNSPTNKQELTNMHYLSYIYIAVLAEARTDRATRTRPRPRPGPQPLPVQLISTYLHNQCGPRSTLGLNAHWTSAENEGWLVAGTSLCKGKRAATAEDWGLELSSSQTLAPLTFEIVCVCLCVWLLLSTCINNDTCLCLCVSVVVVVAAFLYN